MDEARSAWHDHPLRALLGTGKWDTVKASGEHATPMRCWTALHNSMPVSRVELDLSDFSVADTVSLLQTASQRKEWDARLLSLDVDRRGAYGIAHVVFRALWPLHARDFVVRVYPIFEDGEDIIILQTSIVDHAHPPVAGRVRGQIQSVNLVTPLENGGSRLVSLMQLELGGAIPHAFAQYLRPWYGLLRAVHHCRTHGHAPKLVAMESIGIEEHKTSTESKKSGEKLTLLDVTINDEEFSAKESTYHVDFTAPRPGVASLFLDPLIFDALKVDASCTYTLGDKCVNLVFDAGQVRVSLSQ